MAPCISICSPFEHAGVFAQVCLHRCYLLLLVPQSHDSSDFLGQHGANIPCLLTLPPPPQKLQLVTNCVSNSAHTHLVSEAAQPAPDGAFVLLKSHSLELQEDKKGPFR